MSKQKISDEELRKVQRLILDGRKRGYDMLNDWLTARALTKSQRNEMINTCLQRAAMKKNV
jgi:hypothetical protein